MGDTHTGRDGEQDHEQNADPFGRHVIIRIDLEYLGSSNKVKYTVCSTTMRLLKSESRQFTDAYLLRSLWTGPGILRFGRGNWREREERARFK